MKTYHLRFVNRLKLILVLSICMFSTTSCIGDEIREEITLEEAQSLVIFPICFPTYIPTDVDTNPEIIYQKDAANVPEETYIRLLYQRLNSEEKIFEVYQRYTNHKEMKTEYPVSVVENMKERNEILLVWWVIDPEQMSTNETDEAIELTHGTAQANQTKETVWWLFEITDPSEYRSVLTNWVKNHVEYRIHAKLTIEEIAKITESMIQCSNP